MSNPVTELLRRLCACPGTSGRGDPAAAVVEEELGRLAGSASVTRDTLGNVTAFLGDPDAPRQILLDAHLDQIGLVVTRITDEGFLKIAPVGGVDCRVLPCCPVTVYGRETLHGMVSFLPPHLAGEKKDKCPEIDSLAVDAGLSREEAEALVSVGDRIVIDGPFTELLGSRVTGAALDDRAGCAAVLLCAGQLNDRVLDCGVTFSFTSREETGCEGAKTAAYRVSPTEAVVVDVSFGDQPGVPPEKSGKLGGGPMIGVAPSLDTDMKNRLEELCRRQGMDYQLEVMGDSTGTNADSILTAKAGVPSAVLSIPLRYMHTPAEVIDTKDVEAAAQLMSDYVTGGDR